MSKLHRMAVGDAELVALQDTWALIPPGDFFDAVEDGAWDAYPEHLTADGQLTLSLTQWLIRSAGRTILVDTGIGNRPTVFPIQEEPALPTVLQEAGVSPEEIDLVAFTHLHFDHTGWNTVDQDGAPTPLFPNARHVVQQTEWDYWASGAENAASDRPTVLDPITEAGLWDFVDGEHALTREVVTLPTSGHTPGHVSFLLSSGSAAVIVLGDAAHSPVQVSEPEWCIGADVDKVAARRSRRGIWDRAEQEGTAIATNHFPFPGIGQVVTRDGKQRWEPSA